MTKRAKGANSAAHMALAIAGIDWQAIKEGWASGATALQLSELHGATVSNIRSRACREKWPSPRPSMRKDVVKRAAQKAVNKALTQVAKRLEVDAARSVEACIDESITLGRQFMQRAKEAVASTEDGNLSSVATLGRTGVDLWRKSLGLDATGASSVSCAIQFNFVAKGVDAFGVAQDATPGVTGATVDV